MKVIENNYNQDVSYEFKPHKAICENCNSKFIIEEDDLFVTTYGCYAWTCPYCGNENLIDASITLTEYNVEFPKHYAYFGEGKEISDNEINEWTKMCVSKLDKDIDYYMTACGDSFVIAYKSDEEAHEASIIVCKDYYETSVEIPKERY